MSLDEIFSALAFDAQPPSLAEMPVDAVDLSGWAAPIPTAPRPRA